MAYVPANLSLATKGPLTGQGKVWSYFSTDAAATVVGAGYFSDGDAKGLTVGDVVNVVDTDTGPTLTVHLVTAVTAGGAATVGAAI